MSKKSIPIIIGGAQFTQPKKSQQRLDPLNLMVKTCQMALDDIGANDIKEYIDSVYMININSWSYEDAPAELSKIIGIKPIKKIYLPDGGDTPQMLVNRAAKAISSGKSQAILITGGEARYSIYRANKTNTMLKWPKRKNPKYMEGKLWMGINKFENKYRLIFPSCSYAIFESALRAEAGRSLEEHRHYIGNLFEKFSKIASKNPNTWTQKAYTAEELTTATPENRIIYHPYTKRMCSNMFVDQSASLIMTSEEVAKKLKIDKNRWVYLMGSADLKNIHELTRRPQLHDSPAAREGSQLALEQAGLKLENIDKFDLYSCFPSIVEILMKEIGITENDPRDLTVAGGNPFFGGPWSNYTMHAIIRTVNLIRKNPSLKIMVVANGGYNTKQSFGIYGTEGPVKLWDEHDDTKIQQSILAQILPEPVKEVNGQLIIEGYTIAHNRKGNPNQGIVIGRLEDGRRTIAHIEANSEILLNLEQQELVGLTFPVRFDSTIGRNLIILGD
ncbi:MAG: hypothetical protein ACFFAH_13690 [Promethearchaeota archaeon]